MKKEQKKVIIDLDRSVSEFADEVTAEPGGEAIRNCFNCSTCSAGCQVAMATEKFNPRRILRMIIMGQRELVLKSDFIWHCSSCYTCHERCPQGVHLPSVMTALRNIATREGYVPNGYKKQGELVAQLGRLYEIDDFDNKKRRKSGLPDIITDNSIINRLKASLSKERRDKSRGDSRSEDIE